MTAPDKTAQITFQVVGGVPTTPVISGGFVPNGNYTIMIGLMSGSNSNYLAINTPIGVAENSNFSAPFSRGL